MVRRNISGLWEESNHNPRCPAHSLFTIISRLSWLHLTEVNSNCYLYTINNTITVKTDINQNPPVKCARHHLHQTWGVPPLSGKTRLLSEHRCCPQDVQQPLHHPPHLTKPWMQMQTNPQCWRETLSLCEVGGTNQDSAHLWWMCICNIIQERLYSHMLTSYIVKWFMMRATGKLRRL